MTTEPSAITQKEAQTHPQSTLDKANRKGKLEEPPSYDQVDESLIEKGGVLTATKDVELKDALTKPEGVEDCVDYKTIGWLGGSVLLIAETTSLGVFSLSSALSVLGFIGGIFSIILSGIIATYCGYQLYVFKVNHPHVLSISDMGEVFFGRFGYNFLDFIQAILLIFAMASHVLTGSICLNNISEHATCTIIFAIIITVVSIVCSIPRTLKGVGYLTYASFASILIAAIFAMAASSKTLDLKDRKANAVPPVQQPFLTVVSSLLLMFFSFAGHITYFQIISEYKRPADFKKSLYIQQTFNIIFFLIVACVIYKYAGDDVTSPSISALPSPYNKIAYGLAIPTIIIAGVINGHVCAKNIFLRIFRGTHHVHKQSPLVYIVWLSINILAWTIAWVIAESIPVFNNLAGVITSLLLMLFTYGIFGYGWLYDNFKDLRRKPIMTSLNILLVVLSIFMTVAGFWASVVAIMDSTASKPFSCEDNSKL